MRIFSTDPNEPGIFAIGQVAVGVFAFGQLSVGVIAIGQLARGVIAIGQVAVGFVAVGQGALGVLWAGGMGAVGGRGFGLCLKILPKIVLEKFERPQLPPVGTVRDVVEQGRGWVLARIKDGRLHVDGEPVDYALSDQAKAELAKAIQAEHNHACLTMRAEDRVLDQDAGYRQAVERERVLSVARMSSWVERAPQVRLEGPLTSPGGLFLRALGMCVLVAAWYFIAGFEILGMFQ